MALLDNRVATFLEVAGHGSFSSAAKALYISAVSVMKQIESLESELGVRLFDRSPRGATLSLAGDAFLQDAERMRDLADASAARMAAQFCQTMPAVTQRHSSVKSVPVAASVFRIRKTCAQSVRRLSQ